MAWRFKASKFKNAAPIVPKPEACVRDICVGSYQTYGNNIAASAAFMAFNVDHNGSSLGVLPIDDCGRKSKSMPLLHAHSDTVTDMDFSNFHDGLLATGSQDCMVKIWHIPEKGLEESLCNPEITFSHRQRRVECVKWHPTVDCLLTTASYTTLTLWDVTNEKELYSMNGDYGLVQSISWKSDGTHLAFHTKEKTVCILDPRADKITYSADSHQSIKDSRVVWLGDTNRILTTGFDSARQREVYIRDIRNFKTPEKTLVLDSSTGILIPLFDPDTCMLFLAGKGDTTISYLEVTEREPYLVEGIRHTGEQTKGACLVPKRALNVMQAEVNRLLQLTSSSIIPIMYQVPRKSYRDFHSELFPSTAGSESKVNPTQWMQGSDLPVPKISLNPADKQVKPRLGPKPFTPPKFESGDSVERSIILDNDPPATNASNIMTTSLPDFINSNSNSVNGNEKNSPESQPDQENNDEEDGAVESSPTEEDAEDVGGGGDELMRGGVRASIAERRKMYEARSQSVQEPSAVSPVPLRRRDSLKAIKNNAIKEEDNVNQRANQAKSAPIPPTSSAPKRTSTVFGRVSKYRHLKGTPAHKSQHIENVRNVSRQISGECDGFHCNKDRVGVPLGGPGGKLAVFELSKPGKLPDGVIPTLVNATNIMDFSWDPFDNKRLAVGCDDGSVKLWIVPESGLTEATNNADKVLQAHIEKIYCLKFHPLASDILATTSYDMTIRIWDLSTLQQAYCLKTEDHGDSTIYAFEVSSEAPYLNPLSHHRCGSLHQGLSFLPKNCVDVTQVEFAKALRLTNTTIEPLSFTVPRIKVISEAQGAPVSQPNNANPAKEIPNKPAHLPRNSWTDSSIKQKQEQVDPKVSQ
ncbi:unnamed protein product [Nezara viridula]|uniref:Coronin n=1 Tax=Nezara viridula TaxID=85310 RepID=A0A9P0E538_NEZVI|nr:unnamed protein product [Nezara viridula]